MIALLLRFKTDLNLLFFLKVKNYIIVIKYVLSRIKWQKFLQDIQ